MTIQIREEDAVDRGRPFRKLLDGTHEATILRCEQYQKNALSLLVEVVVHPSDKKSAPEGPVICSTYLAMEVTDKVRDVHALSQFCKALGQKKTTDPMEEHEQVGKPIRVITKWVPSRDPQFRDRAEIFGFLPPAPGQKPIALPEAAPPPEDPFAGAH